MRSELRSAAESVVGGVLTAARRPAAERRFRQAAERAGDELNIVVGGGTITVQGWINTDIGFRAQNYLDITKPWPLPDDSVSRIFADNVIEHLTLAEGRSALRNMSAVLKPGGAVRLATPDIGRIARAYLDDREVTAKAMNRHREHGYADVAHPVDVLRVAFTGAKHYLGYMYDLESLSDELRAAGFVDIRREEAGRSSNAEFLQLETRKSEVERVIQLVVEARKPA